MKRLFVFGLIAGFAGTLAAAYWVPWFSYTRYASQTSVVANGGRAEQFVIRLPADRVYPLDQGVEETPESGGSEQPHAYVEHFKLRDTAGNVVGIAARHTLGEEQPATVWLLSIPSRGALMLDGGAVLPATIRALLVQQGWVPGEPWAGQLTLTDGARAESVATTNEFDGLAVELTETWTISGVSPSGELRGTIALNTVGRRGS